MSSLPVALEDLVDEGVTASSSRMSIATDSLAAGLADQARRFVERLEPAPADHHVRAEPREPRGLPGPGRCRLGDQAGLAVEQVGRKDAGGLGHGRGKNSPARGGPAFRRLASLIHYMPLRWPAMKVKAHKRPLEQPLSGGTEGSTVTVEALEIGRMVAPRRSSSSVPAASSRPSYACPRRRARAGGPCSAPPSWSRILTAGHFVVDTGLHPSVTSKPSANMGRLVAQAGRPS